MQLLKTLYDHFVAKASQVEISLVSIGLGYTVVGTADGGVGLSYTYFDRKTSCTMVADNIDYEGRLALELLPKLFSHAPIDRSLALALVNCLNYSPCRELPTDPDNKRLLKTLGVGPGARIAMVGAVPPLINMMEKRGARVQVIDDFKGVGDLLDFNTRLSDWADSVVMTSTTILNNSLEKLLFRLGERVKVALIGPSTPMCLSPFGHLPVHALAGIAVIDGEKIIKAVRHGAGTRTLHTFSRKILLVR